jgi:flavin reductase (DIM6/NTAB) family NADH-FMN oxidoreductase RutF/rubredoxin
MDLNALHKISYGLYIVTSSLGDRFNGQIANSVMQITSEPATIAVSINKKNLTHEYIDSSKVFAVSVLSQTTPLPFIGHWGFKSGRNLNKFESVAYKKGESNCPLVTENAIACLQAKVIRQMDTGTHTIFLGEVTGAEVLSQDTPMTYAYYHEVKRGVTPTTAPTYIKKEEPTVSPAKYRCKVCGYIYDPTVGDPDGKIPAGTPFENLPDTWTCPVCGAAKSEFEKES